MFGRKARETTTVLWEDKPEPKEVTDFKQAYAGMCGSNAKATEDPLDSLRRRLDKLEEAERQRSRNELSDAHRISDIEKHVAGLYLHLGVQRVEITEKIYDELTRLATETRVELRKIAPAKKG